MNIISCSAASKAFALAKQHLPRLILLDLYMPVLSGWEVLEQLKNDPETRDIPVLIVSVGAKPENVERAESMGATGFIAKPFDPKVLVDKVKEVLGIEQ